MIIAVGSTNPVKIEAAKQAAQDLGEILVQGFEVVSGVSHQPRSDAETRAGAAERAHAALIASPYAELGIGFEGGVHEENNSMYNVVWCSVVDKQGQHFEVSGARFLLPEIIANGIRTGKEMGPLLDELLQDENTKQKQGMVGTVTNGYITRTEEYAGLARLAIGLWFGRSWQERLVSSK